MKPKTLAAFCFAGALTFAGPLHAQSSGGYPLDRAPIYEDDITTGRESVSADERDAFGLGTRADEPIPDYPRDGSSGVSPKGGWNDLDNIPNAAEGSAGARPRTPVWKRALLWVPNRFLDLIDIFKLDAGIGPTYGGVVRLSRHGQAGYRKVDPWSFRVGLMGRQAPVMVEEYSERGVGPDFTQSKQRKVCRGEIGVGLDLIAGLYVGLCPDEIVDFVAGIAAEDPFDDDLR